MKKILTILTLSLIAITSIFGKSAQVQLETSIEETPVSYKLAYDGKDLTDGIENYTIEVAPLTKAGNTKDFTIYANSNMNSDLEVTVKVSPHSFKTILNGNTEYDSKIEPKVKSILSIEKITAGLHNKYLVNKFNLFWEGNKDLPAGDYVSNVYIYYSIK